MMFFVIVLPIILFFKIWGMTNDIEKIKMYVINFRDLYRWKNDNSKCRKYTTWELRRMILLGEKQAYKAAIITNFVASVESSDEWSSIDVDEMKNISILDYVKELQEQLDIVGEKVPESISKLQSFYDYYNLVNVEKSNPTEKESAEWCRWGMIP